MISKNISTNEMSSNRWPSDSENTPPDIMFMEKTCASNGVEPLAPTNPNAMRL